MTTIQTGTTLGLFTVMNQDNAVIKKYKHAVLAFLNQICFFVCFLFNFKELIQYVMFSFKEGVSVRVWKRQNT